MNIKLFSGVLLMVGLLLNSSVYAGNQACAEFLQSDEVQRLKRESFLDSRRLVAVCNAHRPTVNKIKSVCTNDRSKEVAAKYTRKFEQKCSG